MALSAVNVIESMEVEEPAGTMSFLIRIVLMFLFGNLVSWAVANFSSPFVTPSSSSAKTKEDQLADDGEAEEGPKENSKEASATLPRSSDKQLEDPEATAEDLPKKKKEADAENTQQQAEDLVVRTTTKSQDTMMITTAPSEEEQQDESGEASTTDGESGETEESCDEATSTEAESESEDEKAPAGQKEKVDLLCGGFEAVNAAAAAKTLHGPPQTSGSKQPSVGDHGSDKAEKKSVENRDSPSPPPPPPSSSGGGPGVAWRPRRAAAAEEKPEDKVLRQVRSVLNKLTREKYAMLYPQLVSQTGIEAEAHVALLAREIFEKATTQHHLVELYADLCTELENDLTKTKTEKEKKTFKRILLEQCQASFERNLSRAAVAPFSAEKLLEEELLERHLKQKERMLGNVKFVGELLKRRLLSPKIIFLCTEDLLLRKTDASLETLCALLESVCPVFDTPAWPAGHTQFQATFQALRRIVNEGKSCNAPSTRVRCLMQDVLEKKARNWAERKTAEEQQQAKHTATPKAVATAPSEKKEQEFRSWERSLRAALPSKGAQSGASLPPAARLESRNSTTTSSPEKKKDDGQLPPWRKAGTLFVKERARSTAAVSPSQAGQRELPAAPPAALASLTSQMKGHSDHSEATKKPNGGCDVGWQRFLKEFDFDLDDRRQQLENEERRRLNKKRCPAQVPKEATERFPITGFLLQD